MQTQVIKTDNLTKFYGSFRGISNLNLSVNEGDFFGFIGPNGAGKSTTIRSLLGLIHATEGTAELFGKNIQEKKNLVALLSDIGYLPSEIQFYSHMKVWDILRFSAKLHGRKCDDTTRKLCERLDLDISRNADDLSLGNRKKRAVD